MNKNLGEIADRTKAKTDAEKLENNKREEEFIREMKIMSDPDYQEFLKCKNKTTSEENKTKEKRAFDNLIIIIVLVLGWTALMALLVWVIK